MPPYPLTNFEIQKYYQNEPKLNNVYSISHLPKITHGTYVINLDEFKTLEIHSIVLYVNNNVTYFDRFGVEHIPKEIKQFVGNKKIITNIYRIQAYDLIMCVYFCIAFIDFMLKGKILLDYTNLFCPNKYGTNDKIILKYFQITKKVKIKNYVASFVVSKENLKNLKYHTS